MATLSAPAPARAAVPRFGHVFVIVGENTSASEVTASRAPYLMRTLRPRGAWLSNYRTFESSKSLGQYVAMVSGQYNRCEALNRLPAGCRQSVPNLFAQLEASGRSWRSWHQSMPASCHRTDAGTYAAHHNPALYFTNLRRSCRTSDLPLGSAFGDAGDFNLVIPNNCDNGHDPCGGDPVRHFDDFLSREIPRIEASPAYGSDGVIIVTWDEGGNPPDDPGHVAALVLGPLVKPGSVDRARHDHYGLERTLAEGFRVAPLARAKRARAISTIWRVSLPRQAGVASDPFE